MPTRVNLSQNEASIVIAIEPLEDSNAVELGRVKTIVSILENWIEANASFDAIPDDKKMGRAKAFMAQDLKVQIALAELHKQSDLLTKIADGSQRIEDHGLPEFQDD